MEVNKNHIGTAFYLVKTIATNLGYEYSHGNLSDFDFKQFSVFPLCHNTIQSVSVQDSTSIVSLSITIADRVIFTKTENQGDDLAVLFSQYGYTENSNYAQILQSMYVDFITELRKQEQLLYNNLNYARPISMTPFVETLNSVLAGFTLTLDLTITNPLVTDGFC